MSASLCSRSVTEGADRMEARAMILALETSCDDTCAAVIDVDGKIRANVICGIL